VRLVLDKDVCTGHGRCYSLGPDVFGADERGHCELLVVDVPAEHEHQARLGVTNCPEKALAIEGE
jgi:ferredoxin